MVTRVTKHVEEISNRFLVELISLTRHIANVSHEGTEIGGGIFILHVIATTEECVMRDIVEILNLGASTATRQVDSLVKQDLIERGVSKTDRRKVSLMLTEAGREIYTRFRNHLRQVMSSSLQDYSEQEITQAIKIFHTIVEYSEKYLPLE